MRASAFVQHRRMSSSPILSGASALCVGASAACFDPRTLGTSGGAKMIMQQWSVRLKER